MTENENPRTLLGVFAHPDDESFGSGGTLAYYASNGSHVALVCATRGEVGEIADPDLATPETLPQVREQELRTAAKALGINDVTFLGYRDSGMAGTADNENPAALVNADSDEVVSRLVGIIRSVNPQVVLTFDPQGGYGHPDHITISNHALTAFQAAGDSSRFPHMGEPWQPSRLFYAVFSRGRSRELRDRLKALGQDTSRFDQREREGYGWPDDKIHVTMNVSETVDAKWTALTSHRTQYGTFTAFRNMPEKDAKQFMSTETFSLAAPEPSEGLRLNDLFDSL